MVAAHALQNYFEDRGYAADLYCWQYVIEDRENMYEKTFCGFTGWLIYLALVDFHLNNYVHAQRLSKLIEQNKYKFIVSTDYRTGFLDFIDTKVPIFVLPCDVKCVPPTYDSRKAKYLINTDVGEKYAIECGVPKANIIRIPELSFACNRELLTDTKPMLERRKELGLPLDRKVALVQWGSLGSDEFVKIYNNLKDRKDLHLVFVCGMNRKGYNKMIELVGDNATVLPI
jgi:hypothetical protein